MVGVAKWRGPSFTTPDTTPEHLSALLSAYKIMWRGGGGRAMPQLHTAQDQATAQELIKKEHARFTAGGGLPAVCRLCFSVPFQSFRHFGTRTQR